VGAMVHETVHVAQRYRTRNNPGWLVEGVADYVRFYKYEPGKLKPLPPEKAKYNGSYQVTARFLAFLVERYDKQIVRKLNQVMRDGEYREEIWKTLTKKTLSELGDEWKESLRPSGTQDETAVRLHRLDFARRSCSKTISWQMQPCPGDS